MKLILALVLSVAVYVALGAVVPFTGKTALVITLLGSLGAFTYKGVVAFVAFAGLSRG
jgi:hypothetical protein